MLLARKGCTFSFYKCRIEGLRLEFRLVSRMSISLLSFREGLRLDVRLVSFCCIMPLELFGCSTSVGGIP